MSIEGKRGTRTTHQATNWYHSINIVHKCHWWLAEGICAWGVSLSISAVFFGGRKGFSWEGKVGESIAFLSLHSLLCSWSLHSMCYTHTWPLYLHYILLTPAPCMLYTPDPCTLCITYSWPLPSIHYVLLNQYLSKAVTAALCVLHTPDTCFLYISNPCTLCLQTAALYTLYCILHISDQSVHCLNNFWF